MRTYLLFLVLGASAASVVGDVRVYVEDVHGAAAVKYECTAGEVVRAFALDVWVDRGSVVGVSDFFRGQSKAGSTGYGIFPASFRDHLAVGAATNVDWNVPEYTPLASAADAPEGRLPGLNSSGVTLEFAGLWDPAVTAAVPAPAGLLCVLGLSRPAHVSIGPNLVRGGVVSTEPATIPAIFAGTTVGPMITGFSIVNGQVQITFHGGELQTATAVDGQWDDTGNTSGQYSEAVGDHKTRYYRVHASPDPE